MRNREAGARHVSSNRRIHHYDEGPAEKLDSLLADYLAVEAENNGARKDNWITWTTRVSSKQGQVFNHTEMLEYLKALREFRPHFNVDTYFSVKFCMETLHNVNGSVSDTYSTISRLQSDF
jgi:hypothetical protein